MSKKSNKSRRREERRDRRERKRADAFFVDDPIFTPAPSAKTTGGKKS